MKKLSLVKSIYMSNEVLEKVKLLPSDQQKAVEDFILALLNQHEHLESTKDESLADMRRRNMGWAKGKIWMADDFNETPDDFKDYI